MFASDLLTAEEASVPSERKKKRGGKKERSGGEEAPEMQFKMFPASLGFTFSSSVEEKVLQVVDVQTQHP